jgi:hypothetical protein
MTGDLTNSLVSYQNLSEVGLPHHPVSSTRATDVYPISVILGQASLASEDPGSHEHLGFIHLQRGVPGLRYACPSTTEKKASTEQSRCWRLGVTVIQR